MSALPNQAPGVLERLGLTRADADRWVWAIEPSGRRLHGAAAAARALRELGGGWAALGWLFRLPGAGLAYAAVARSRGMLSRVWGDPPPY